MESTLRKIQLVQPSLRHVELLLTWENNPKNWKFGNTRGVYTHEEMLGFVQSKHDLENAGQQRWMIENEEGLPIGTIDLFDFSKQKMRGSVGILIAEEDERGKGYAKSALLSLIEICKKLEFKELRSTVFYNNKASLALFKSTGFNNSNLDMAGDYKEMRYTF